MPKINSSFTADIRHPAGDSLLDYLARRFTYHGREEWSALLAQGRLALEGATARGDEPLREGMRLRFEVVDYDEPEVPLDYRVLERSGDLCFVHKPAGLPMHRTGRIFFQTLANLIKESLGFEWAPLNRLDRETSGLMAFARGADAVRTLSPSAPGSRWLKLYAAVVRGAPPAPSGRIDMPLAESAQNAIRCRMDPHPHGKPSLTLYRTIAQRDGFSLLALSPVTGRKHQLRAHLAAAGCPIVGDKIYSLGGKAYLKQLDRDLDAEDYRELGAERHLLHAFYLRVGAGDSDSEAWDWDVGPAFSAYFKGLIARQWCATPALMDLMAEAEAAKRSFG